MQTPSHKELLDAGCHFGHMKRKWNPKMSPYIFMERKDVSLNMDYDWKRELIDPEEVVVGRNFGKANATHITLQSKPHKDVEALEEARKQFKNWRDKERGVLKTMSDWERWNTYRYTASLRKSGVLTGRGSALDQAKRIFLKAYANKLWGLTGDNYQAVADWLTDAGYPTKLNDVKNAKRSKVDVNQFPNLKFEDVDAFKAVLLECYSIKTYII